MDNRYKRYIQVILPNLSLIRSGGGLQVYVGNLRRMYVDPKPARPLNGPHRKPNVLSFSTPSGLGLPLSTIVTNRQISRFNPNTTNAVGGGESGQPEILPASALLYLFQPILYQGTDNYNNIFLQRIGKLQNKQLIQSLSVSKLARFESDRLGGSVTDACRQFRTNTRRP